MREFIKLTGFYGQTLFLKASHITSFYREEGSETSVITVYGAGKVFARESSEEIQKILNERLGVNEQQN